MSEYPVRTADQLPDLLSAFRKAAGLSQGELAARLGVTQQTVSALERRAEKVSAERLIKLFGILGVELVLRQHDAPSAQGTPPAANPNKPVW